MNDEMKTEAMELCVTACEKFASNNEVRASATYNKGAIKENSNSNALGGLFRLVTAPSYHILVL